jgi:Delta24-sterol reductase
MSNIGELQEKIRANFIGKKENLSLYYDINRSNTARSKAYKARSIELPFKGFDRILEIDCKRRIAHVEPRVTMEQLVRKTLKYQLIPAVIPEFKGITIGGAIMGIGGESSSHQWGSFNDICLSFDLIGGDGSLFHLSPQENSDLFYGIAGSYGSLGPLISAEIQLIPAKEFVSLRNHVVSSAREAVALMQNLYQRKDPPDFIDGIVFSKDLAVVIEGTMQEQRGNLPEFSLKSITDCWYYEHIGRKAKKRKSWEEAMPLFDYLFRYDQGAFWMGSYLEKLPFLKNAVGDKMYKSLRPLILSTLCLFRTPFLGKTLFHSFWTSKNLYRLLRWKMEGVHKQTVIQDFCIPETQAVHFLEDAMDSPAIFPIWICPIKATKMPEIFAPHLISGAYAFDIGIYGALPLGDSSEEVTRMLEKKMKNYGGRKVLYTRSSYTEEEFWEIYSQSAYESLRKKTKSEGIWLEITDKVLSR